MNSKYKDIVIDIEKDILDGKYNQTKKLPTEEEFVKKYKVSRTTIRKAINLLANSGYVYQVQGSGIFIRESALHDYISLEKLNGLTKDYPNKKVTSKIIRLEILEADEELARKLECNVGTKLYFLERARIVDGEPFTIEYTYFNKDIVPYLNEEIAEKSIYAYITKDLKYTIGMLNFHSKKVMCIQQEIYAHMIMYNFVQMITSHVVITKKQRKHTYKANFSVATHICRLFYREKTTSPNLETIIAKNLIPIRSDRHRERKLKVQTFRGFLYRVA